MDDALVSSALAGTSRRVPDLTTTTPIDSLIGALGDKSRERALLLAAGAAALYDSAGLVAAKAPDEQAPAPLETRTEASPRAAALVALMLDDGTYREFLPEALERMRRAGLILPPWLLPDALAATGDVREALRPVLGERGRWLARFNPAWRWAVDSPVDASGSLPDDAKTIWENGTEAERLAVLRLLRRHDPAEARAWVESVWSVEKAEVRKDMLETYAVSLSMDDEPFLESTLDDRSSTVRGASAALLARLPDSRLAARMRARGDAVLSFEKKMLRGWRIDVTLPESVSKDWLRDGVETKPPHGMGAGQWLLEQVIAAVAPNHWEARSGAKPRDLLAAAAKTEWEDALLQGWRRAATSYKDVDWAALFYRRDRKDGAFSIDGDLLALLPLDHIEKITLDLVALIGASDQNGWTLGVLGSALDAMPTPWRPAFGSAFLVALRTRVKDVVKEGSYRYQQSDIWSQAVRALPPECFGDALLPWRILEHKDAPSIARQWQNQIDGFMTSIRFRQEMIKEIPL